MKTLTLDRGQVIFRQGEYPHSMYDIVKGCVGIFADYGTEREKEIARLGDKQILGEMGMLEIYPRSATAVALEDGTTLSEITEAELSDYFKNKPEKLLTIMRQLSRRIRETDAKFINACRAVYESDEKERTGTGRGEQLNAQLNGMYEDYEKSIGRSNGR